MVVILPYNLGFVKKTEGNSAFLHVPMRNNVHPNRAYVTLSHFILLYATNLWTTALVENNQW